MTWGVEILKFYIDYFFFENKVQGVFEDTDFKYQHLSYKKNYAGGENNL